MNRLALALRLYLWVSILLGIAFMLGDIISGFNDGWNAREAGYRMQHTLAVTPQQDSIWYEDARLAVTGVQSITIREKDNAPPLPIPLRVLDGLLTTGAFALFYFMIRLLRKSLTLIRRFERNEWLQPTAIAELNLLGRLFFFIGLGTCAWELLHQLHLQQAFKIPGYSHRFDWVPDISWMGLGLILWGIAAVLQYTLALKEEQELTV